MRYQRAETPLKFDGVLAAREFFSGCIAERAQESETLWIAHLDDQARCLHLAHVEGDACGVDFPLRDIIVDAARHGSAALLLAHNHPSGDPRPSESDLSATRRLAAVAEAMDCRLLDHLVFAGDECRSMRRMGLL